MGVSWLTLGRHWPILGQTWGHVGDILGLCWGAEPPKTLIFLRFFKCFGHWAIFLSVSTNLPYIAPSWAFLGPSWDPLGPSWGHLGALLGLLGATLVSSWPILGTSWAARGHLQATCTNLLPSWVNFASTWPLWGSIQGPSGPSPDSFLDRLGPILSLFWAHLEIILGVSFAILGQSTCPSAISDRTVLS